MWTYMSAATLFIIVKQKCLRYPSTNQQKKEITYIRVFDSAIKN